MFRRKFGNPRISWQRIIQPTIDMCRQGIRVSATMADTLMGLNYSDPGWRRTFIDPDTGVGWREGQLYTRTDLADTLEMLAEVGDEGDQLFYNGTIGQMLVEDLQDLGGIITLEDMSSYQVEWQEPVSVLLNSTKMTLLSVPPPGSGSVLAAILNIMQVSQYHQPNIIITLVSTYTVSSVQHKTHWTLLYICTRHIRAELRSRFPKLSRQI